MNKYVSVSLQQLLDLAKNTKHLKISDSRLRNLSGNYKTRILSRGMEFAESRQYQVGDESRNIDWKVTARTGKPHTKLFTEEKERQVILCVDMRPPMFFGTQNMFKSVRASLLAGTLAWQALEHGSRIGGVIFDGIEQVQFKPSLGKKAVLPFFQKLAEKGIYDPNKKGGTSFLKELRVKGSVIFIMSDFRHFTVEAADFIRDLAKYNDIRLCFLYDPIEADLPQGGFYPISHGGVLKMINTQDEKALMRYREQFLERREKVASLAKGKHIQFREYATNE